MRILDRQRYWAFFKAYVICFIALVGLYVVIDAFSNVDEFSEISNGTVDLLRRMGWYYLVRLSRFYDQLCGIITMMAAVFTVTWMQKNNELLAMLAAGISTRRVIVPVIVAAALVSILNVVNQELIIPRVAEELQRTPDDDGSLKLKVWGRVDLNEVLIHGGFGYRDGQIIEPFNATLPPSRFGTLMKLDGKQARFIPESNTQSPLRGGWIIWGAQLSPAGKLPITDFLFRLPPDSPQWFPKPLGGDKGLRELMAGGDAYFLKTNVSFTTVTRNRAWYQFADTLELLRALNDPTSATERVEIAVFLHGRILRPLMAMTLLILSLPFVLGGENRNMFINLGLSLGTSALFYCVLFLVQYLGSNKAFPPELAGWLPIIAFGTLAVARWDRIRT